MLAFLDRQLLALLVDPVKRDLQLSDTQVGLLLGPAFGVVYVAAAFPLARLADRLSHKRVLLGAVALWGVMTMACAAARDFRLLLLTRMGVGLGEAALSPIAYAISAEGAAQSGRGRPLGFFLLGGSTGYGLALLLGGSILALLGSGPAASGMEPWRLAFLATGALTVLAALLIPLVRSAPATRANVAGVGDVVRELRSHLRAYAAIFLSGPLLNVAAYAVVSWLPTIMIRTHRWSAAGTGVTLGIGALVAGGAGTIAGALAHDTLAKDQPGAALPLSMIGAVAFATSCVLLLSPRTELALLFIALANFLIGWLVVTTPLALISLAPRGLTTQISALYLTLTGLAGLVAGPVLGPLMSHLLAGGRGDLGLATATVASLCAFAGVAIMLCFRESFRQAAALRNLQPSQGVVSLAAHPSSRTGKG